jgi:hypothetical protein
MPLLTDSMTEQEQTKFRWGWVVLIAISVNVLPRILSLWVRQPISYGLTLLILLIGGYWIKNHGQIGIIRWILGSIIITLLFIGAFFGLPYLFCGVIGAGLTWGLMIFGLLLSQRWIQWSLFRIEPKDSLQKWLLMAAASGLVFGIIAAFIPNSLCSGW